MKVYKIKRIARPYKCSGCGIWMERGEKGIYVLKSFGNITYKVRFHNEKCLKKSQFSKPKSLYIS